MTAVVRQANQIETEAMPELQSLQPDGRETARAAHLRYVSDEAPGIRRRRAGRGFTYLDPDGKTVRDPKTLRRIRSLAIPPAWTDVWICPHANGHIQAAARDAKGRKQYRYHPRWQEERDQNKYHRMVAFGLALAAIRERVALDLSLRGMQRARLLATVVRLLEETLIRVGNEEYARSNRSYGLTTLRNRHVTVEGSTVRFRFRGKSGKEHAIEIRDRRVAPILRKLQELPGQELFQYLDDEGRLHSISSQDVNDYLREITGQDFTAKDFRTWAGTVQVFLELKACGECESPTHARKNVVQAIRSVSNRLGNTPAVCRRCYVHPAVLEAYLEGALLNDAEPAPETPDGLDPDEAMVLRFLQNR